MTMWTNAVFWNASNVHLYLSLEHVLLILEAFKDQVTLLVLELLDAVVCAHVVEFADFVALDELLITIIQIVVLLLGLCPSAIWVEHVGAEVEDCSLINITILII